MLIEVSRPGEWILLPMVGGVLKGWYCQGSGLLVLTMELEPAQASSQVLMVTFFRNFPNWLFCYILLLSLLRRLFTSIGSLWWTTIVFSPTDPVDVCKLERLIVERSKIIRKKAKPGGQEVRVAKHCGKTVNKGFN